jgi:hypothetical protein
MPTQKLEYAVEEHVTDGCTHEAVTVRYVPPVTAYPDQLVLVLLLILWLGATPGCRNAPCIGPAAPAPGAVNTPVSPARAAVATMTAIRVTEVGMAAPC